MIPFIEVGLDQTVALPKVTVPFLTSSYVFSCGTMLIAVFIAA